MEKTLENKILERKKIILDELKKLNSELEFIEEVEALYGKLSTQSKKEMLRDFDESFKIDGAGYRSNIDRIAKTDSTEGKWVLKAGSQTLAHNYWEEHGGSNMPYARFYQRHMNSIDKNTGMVIEDIYDTSISNLVAISRGKPSATGWTEVKNEKGETPDELYRR